MTLDYWQSPESLFAGRPIVKYKRYPSPWAVTIVYKREFLTQNDYMDIWDLIFLVPFLCGLYIFVKNPIYVRYQTDSWVDSASGFCLVLISALYFYFVHFAGQLTPEGDRSPCGSLSKQMECYKLTEATCMSAWNSSKGDCQDRLETILKTRPSFLSGNFLETCVGKNFDKIMHYNRKNEKTVSCQSYFLKIDRRD